MDWGEEYDKIYRYCYFKLHSRETAEDVTQEVFLRYLQYTDRAEDGGLRLLYTIARNACVDEYRRKKPEMLPEEPPGEGWEEQAALRLDVRAALEKLEEGERELLLLRYANGVPVSVLAGLYGLSRFACYRRLRKAEKELQSYLEEGEKREKALEKGDRGGLRSAKAPAEGGIPPPPAGGEDP